MSLPYPARQIRQPQQPVPIDRGNALGAKVITAIPFSGGRRALVSGGTITYGTPPNATTVTTAKGRSLRALGASGARASVPLDLSKYSVITLAYWLYWDAYANDDAFAMEFTTNANNTAGSFYIDPNSGANGGRFAIVPNGSGANGNGTLFDRPSAAAWHRECISIDIRTQAVSFFVDGVQMVGVAAGAPSTVGTTFANSTLHLFSRAGTGLFGTGNLQDLTIYAGALSPTEMAQDFANPWQIYASTPRRTWVTTVASAAVAISPDPGTGTANSSAPTIGQPITVTPAAASASATGAGPTVAQPVSISPGAAASVAAGATPSIAQPVTVTPAAAAASAVGTAPNIAQSVSISPLPAACIGTGAAPTIVRGQSVTPGAAAVTAAGAAPDINQGLSVTPGAAAVVAAGAPPSIVRGQSVTPGAAVVTAAGAAPTVAQPSGISPAPAVVTAAGGMPTLIQGRSLTPGAAAVTAAGAAPNISGAPLISPAACTIVVASPAPSISQPIIPIPTRSIDIKQDDLLTAIRSFLLTLVTQPVLRTPINRAVMPVGSHITMSPGSVKALATNTHGPIINGVRSVKRSSQFDCQIDCYGIDAGDTAAMISMMFRDQYAIEQFELQPFEIVPLYAEDAHQMPVVTGEEQYLERWTFDIVVQFNPVVSMVAQSATMLELSLRNVDRTYPP